MDWNQLFQLQDIDSGDLPEGEAARRRDALVRGLPPDTMAQYDRVRRGKSAPWVLRLVSGACPRCHMMLPTKQFGDLQRVTRPSQCPGCTRLLIWLEPTASSAR